MKPNIENERAAGYLAVFGSGYLTDDPHMNARIWRIVEVYREAAEANRADRFVADESFEADVESFVVENDRDWFTGENRSPYPNELAAEIYQWMKKRYCVHVWVPVPAGRGERCTVCFSHRDEAGRVTA